jgi:predicted metal-dependent phosphoesterase TrpH
MAQLFTREKLTVCPHSAFSSPSPQLAAAQGLRGVWLTDHDMIREPARTQALLESARSAGVRLGMGVEITVALCGHEHHLLGYFPDSTWAGPHLSTEMLAVQRACAEVIGSVPCSTVCVSREARPGK